MQIALATEDELSEAIGIRLLAEWAVLSHVKPMLLRKNGFGYLRSRMDNWKQMANRQIVMVLTDLDKLACPIVLRNDWLGKDTICPKNLLLRIAVREVESWVLADHEGMRQLIGSKGRLPPIPDELLDPKQHLLELARLAPRKIREDLLTSEGAIASQGIGYNHRLVAWVQSVWCPQRAAERSPSLRRTLTVLANLAEEVV